MDWLIFDTTNQDDVHNTKTRSHKLKMKISNIDYFNILNEIRLWSYKNTNLKMFELIWKIKKMTQFNSQRIKELGVMQLIINLVHIKPYTA